MLTAMSVKISSCFGQDVAGISNDELYARVKEEGVPFHRWHAWVHETLTRESERDDSATSNPRAGTPPRSAPPDSNVSGHESSPLAACMNRE